MEYDLTPAAEIPSAKNVAMHGHTPPNRCCHDSLDSIAHELARNDVRIYAPHNYYCYDLYPRLAELVRMRAGAYMVNAAEIIASSTEPMTFNDFEPQRIYACIVGAPTLNEMEGKAEEIFESIRSEDNGRMLRMYAKANQDLAALGYTLNYTQGHEAFCEQFGLASEHTTFVMQERQMAQRICELCHRSGDKIEDLVQRLTGEHIEPALSDKDTLLVAEDVIRSAMIKQGKPWYVPLAPLPLQQVKEAADALDALLFYPRLGDAKPDSYTDLERDDDAFIEWLKDNYFDGIEIIMSRNSSGEISRIVPKVREAGLLAIPGEEQNTGRKTSILPTPRHGILPEGIRQAFWIDSLVCVAHQELAAEDQWGWRLRTAEREQLRSEVARIGANILEQTYWER